MKLSRQKWKAYIFLAFFVAAEAFLISRFWSAASTGQISWSSRFGDHHYSATVAADPMAYWLQMAVMVGCIAFLVFLIGRLVQVITSTKTTGPSEPQP